MNETQTGELLLLPAALFGLTFALGGLLEKLRIPGILGALFVAMAAHYTPLGSALTQAPLSDAFSFLAQLGVMLLLFSSGCGEPESWKKRHKQRKPVTMPRQSHGMPVSLRMYYVHSQWIRNRG